MATSKPSRIGGERSKLKPPDVQERRFNWSAAEPSRRLALDVSARVPIPVCTKGGARMIRLGFDNSYRRLPARFFSQWASRFRLACATLGSSPALK